MNAGYISDIISPTLTLTPVCSRRADPLAAGVRACAPAAQLLPGGRALLRQLPRACQGRQALRWLRDGELHARVLREGSALGGSTQARVDLRSHRGLGK